MDFKDWEPKYEQILADFGFDRGEDERSAAFLSEQLTAMKDKIILASDGDLMALLKNQKVYVFGEGPTLEADLDMFDGKGTIIAADGATSALMARNIVPAIIVTDLDGNIDDQVKAVEMGAIALIHAHSDNRKQLKKWLPRFSGKVMGTTQAEPLSNLSNYGGFTDGDRAVFLADHFGAGSINLVAFDFLEVGDRPKKDDEDRKLKLRKLTWANLLIGTLANPRIEFVPPKGKEREFLL